MQCVFHFSRNSRSQFPGSQPSDSLQEVLHGFLVCAQARDFVGFKLERRTVLNLTFHLNYLNYPPCYSLIVDKSEIQILSLISKNVLETISEELENEIYNESYNEMPE